MAVIDKKKQFCGCLIVKSGKVLLQLRDDTPSINFPNAWGTFGGLIEPGETPKEAIIRELKEELDYDLVNPQLFGVHPFEGNDIFNFYVVDEQFDENGPLFEGQDKKFFSLEELRALPCAFNAQEIVEDFYKKCAPKGGPQSTRRG